MMLKLPIKTIKRIYHWCTKTRLRKILSSVLIFLILLTSIKYIFISPPPAKAADVYLGLNEGYGSSINDSKQAVTAGTITGATWRNEEFCKNGKCLYFDGTQDFVSFADDADLDFAAADSFTVNLWFRSPTVTTGTHILAGKILDSDNDGGYQIQMESDGDITCEIEDDDADTTIDDDVASTTANYDDNQWHFVSCVKNGTTSLTLYIDNIQIEQDAALDASSTLANDDSFYIGIDGDGTSNDYAGFIDEVTVYRSARTLAELKSDYAGETPSRGTSASFGPTQDYLSNGLVGYWKMEDTTDASGNGTTLTNNSTTPFTTAKFGNGSEHDGTTDYFEAADNATLSLVGDVTLAAWINNDDTTGSQNIVGKWDGTNNSYLLALEGDELRMYIDSATNHQTTTAANLSSNTFTHVAGVYNSTLQTVKLFVNGVEQASTTTGGTIPASIGDDAGEFVIGADDSPTGYFDGHIDDVRIYNRPLPSDNIQKLYTWAPGPISYWQLDDNTGQAANDVSGNGNAQTLGSSSSTESSDPVWNKGRYGSGLNFDGSNDFAFSTDAFYSDAFTVCAWINLESTSANGRMIVNKYNSSGVTSGSPEWLLFVSGTTPGFTSFQNNTTSTGVDFGSNTTIALNTWYHICGVQRGNGNNASIYINGIEDGLSVGTRAQTAAMQNTTTLVELGSRVNNDDTVYWDGSIDDVRIYNYARSPSQVIEDMNGGHPAPGSPIGSYAARWKFDEGALNTCSGGANDYCDSSINSNDLAFSTTTGGHTNSGKFGKAFNGATNLRASRTDDPDLDFAAGESFTFSLWFKSDSATNPSANEYLLEKGGNIATDAIGYAVYTSAASDGLICFGIDDDATTFPEDSVCSSADYYDAAWHHLTVKKTADSRLDLYIDGKSDGTPDTAISATGTLANTATFYIGDTNATDGTDEFLGDIDEVQIFRAALTQDQIYSLYNQGASANMGATSTDSSGNPTWSSDNEYCPPGQGSACTVPVGHWKLDENTGTSAYDISAHGYTGTLTGTSVWGIGKTGSGLSTTINAVQEYVTVADPASGDLDFTASDDFTLEAWVKLTSVETTVTIIDKNFNGNPALAGYAMVVSASGGTYPLVCYFSDGVGGTFDQTPGAYTGSLNDGNWHHLACVMDRDGSEFGTAGLYALIDGVGVDTDTSLTEGTSANTAAVVLGEFDAAAEIGNGAMDDFRIYKYARTPTQIAWDMIRGKATTWLKFDENTGSPTTLNDASGKGNNGTASGTMDSADWLAGKYNASLDFDGSDDVVSVANSTTTDLNAGLGGGFSFSAWIYPNTVGETAGRIFQKGTNGSTTDTSTTFCRVEGSTPFDITCRVDLATADANFTFSGVAPANQWSHVVFTWNNDADDEVTIWVNGIASTSTASFSGNTTAEANSLYIAGNGTTTSNTRAFDGQIDDFRIYNYELTRQQVWTVMNEGAVNRFGPATGSP